MKISFSLFFTLFCSLNISAQGDFEPPKLKGFKITPDTIDVSNGSKQITFEVAATDNLSGVKYVYLEYEIPGGGVPFTWLSLISGTSQDGIFKSTVVFDQNTAQGIWKISALQLIDFQGNLRILHNADFVTAGFTSEFIVINDLCPNDPQKTSPGLCGCGIPDKDSDCDGIPDCKDVCPGGDDKIDNNHDGKPDCKFPPSFNLIIPAWKVNNNQQVYICHKPNQKIIGCNISGSTLTVPYNTLSSHIGHGDFLGKSGNANCCGLLPRSSDEDIESLTQHELKLFPNPAQNILNIHLPFSTSKPVQMQVYNSLGQVLNEYRNLENGTTKILLNIETIKGGYYYLKVSSGGYKEIKPFVKLK